MRIEKLTLRGFLRFRDQVSIDLTGIPDGLVAIVGPNGSGKTTLLEAAPAALYRSFMSRGDVVDYATARDSFLELQLAVDGHGTFRARVNVDGPKRNSDAVLEAVQPDGSRRVLNDGKVSTFDQVVAREFPSKDLLLASAFASQNKAGSFISLDKKRRKELFAQLLGIERYQAMSDTARQAAGFVEQTRSRLQVRRELLERDTADRLREELDRLAQELEAANGVAETRRDDVRDAIARLEARLAMMADAVAAYASATQRRSTLQTELASRQTERRGFDDAQRQLQLDLEADRRRVATRRTSDLQAVDRELTATATTRDHDLQAAASRRDTDVADVAKRIAGNRQILDMAADIRAAVQATADLTASSTTLEQEHAERQTQLEDRRRALATIDHQLAALFGPEEQLAQARQHGALLGTVPCGGTGTYAACQFLAHAQRAEGRIPALEATLSTRPALTAERAERLTAIAALETAIATTKGRLADLAMQRATHARLTQYHEQLAAAEARIAELTTRQAQIARDFDDAMAAAQARYDERAIALQERRAHIDSQERADLASIDKRGVSVAAALTGKAAELDVTIARLTRELAEADTDLQQTAAANETAIRLQSELRDERAAWDSVTTTLARVESGRQELQRRRQEFDGKRAELADVNGRLARLSDELLEWQLLAKAFGRDGLPVLEIDAAGPTISAYTNELLEVCFGPRFSVELVTQRAKADGKGFTDDFSIRVLDNQRGGEGRDIADLSGGEQVIVAEALSNAICIYVNTRSPMPVRTCWRDETTGALDPENATRYLAMLRKVQELGGFAHVIFISHNLDAAAQADAQIQLHDGTAAIVFPPYALTEAA